MAQMAQKGMKKILTHFDLFSGIGGFALAARWAGIETVAFCEIDSFCYKVLMKHWPGVLKYRDIRDVVNPGYVDIVTAGFPCQPFSCAGKKKGKDDDRYLWPETIRIISEVRPDWVILENVSGIVPHLDPILDDLEREGYAWQAYLIPASSIGAPHKRERLWIIAHANGQRCNDGFDSGKKRYIQDNIDGHIKTIQSEWARFLPESWQTFNAQSWFDSSFNADGITGIEANQKTESKPDKQNTRMGHSRLHRTDEAIFNREENQPPLPGVDDGLPHIVDRNRALGNSIVPQIPYVFFKIICLLESIESDPHQVI